MSFAHCLYDNLCVSGMKVEGGADGPEGPQGPTGDPGDAGANWFVIGQPSMVDVASNRRRSKSIYVAWRVCG